MVACVLNEPGCGLYIILAREESKKSTTVTDMGVVRTIEDRRNPAYRTPCSRGDKPHDFAILPLKQAVRL